MRTYFVTPLAVLGLGAIVVACSLSISPPPDDNVTDFCNDWAKAKCQVGSGPCAFPEAPCAAYQTTQCMNFVSAAQSGTREYKQSNGKACIDALNSAYGGGQTSISASTLLNVDAICGKVVVGSQALNQSCTGDNDCSGSLVCAPVVGQNQSVCVSAATPKDAGDFCADPGDECQGDSYCAAQAGGAPQCVPTPPTNAPCSAATPCGSSDTCQNGICVARGGSGATCTSSADCASSAPYCDTYPPAACTTGITFGRGGYDCNGIAGLSSSAGGQADAASED
jgi:hypothetical protein